MIPTQIQAKALWDKYNLPQPKRIHVQLVANVALFLADLVAQEESSAVIDNQLLHVSALLHDIDKNIPRLSGEGHPETGVRILLAENMAEVANLIKYHSVQFIQQDETAPKTWEEKLLFLSDKMVKQEVITVDKRFELWLAEDDLPDDQKVMLRTVYPKVKALEQEIFTTIGMKPSEVVQYV